uniref:Putative ovule protein n=1 Tax=Solanum chacoense TaxID=4108 RepID=A0A0V0H932_SOLCH
MSSCPPLFIFSLRINMFFLENLNLDIDKVIYIKCCGPQTRCTVSFMIFHRKKYMNNLRLGLEDQQLQNTTCHNFW